MSTLLTGCGSAQPAPAATAAHQRAPALSGLHALSSRTARTYLGAVTGTQAFMGIVVDGTRGRAYVCDGTQRRAGTLADWFAGPVRNGTFAAASSQHHARLTARLGGQRATGTITRADGKTVRFAIALAPAGHPAGIFAGTAHFRGRSYLAGWIILPAALSAARRSTPPARSGG